MLVAAAGTTKRSARAGSGVRLAASRSSAGTKARCHGER